jgi:hypothetical protein
MPSALYDGVAAGLRIDAFEEPLCEGREYPHWLALRATR